MVENPGKRYAEAIYEIAKESKLSEELFNFLGEVEKIYKNPEFKSYLSHPIVKKDDKLKVIDKIFADATELEKNIVAYLVEKNRLSEISSIFVEYKKLYYVTANIIDATATFATKLSDEKIKALADKLSKSTGKKVNLEVGIDSSLIAGGIIRIGDKVIDGSVKAKLNEMGKAE